MSKFVYIPSAFNSAAAFLTVHKMYPELSKEIFESINNQEKDIHLGVLSNAFTEKKDTKEFSDIFSGSHIPLYGDSGGLQVITRGMQVTSEIKNKIFNTQAEYADFSMSFDEIPVEVLKRVKGNPSANTNTYIDSWFKEKAIESGKNIVEQIKAFKKNPKNRSKIMFIVQGRDFNTAREWSWYMFQEIKEEPDYKDYIGGLALGNVGAAGTRNITDFLLRFQYELDFLPQEWLLNLHILGAGSLSRIAPYFLVAPTYFLENTVVTSDSTTQTRAPIFGVFATFTGSEYKTVDVGREISESSLFTVQKIYDFVKPFIDNHKDEYDLVPENVEDFREHYTEFNDAGLRKITEFDDVYDYHKRARASRYFWSMTMISHYIKFLAYVKKLGIAYRSDKTSPAQKLIIKKRVAVLFKGDAVRAATKLMEIKTHSQYMKDRTVLKGHPYAEITSAFTDLGNGIIQIDKDKWITDTYNNKLYGRKLDNLDANEKLPFTNKTHTLLNELKGNKIGTFATPEDLSNNPKVQKIDIW